MTNRKWVTLHFFTIESHCISSHDQQAVSDTAFFFFMLITWPTVCEWHCIFFFTTQSHYISSHVQTGSVWSFVFFFTIQSHCISSYDQQIVSDTSPPLSHSLIAFHPVANRKWVTAFFFTMQPHSVTNSVWVILHLLFLTTISSHGQHTIHSMSVMLFLSLLGCISKPDAQWSTGSKWSCTYLCLKPSYHNFSLPKESESNSLCKPLLHLTSCVTGCKWFRQLQQMLCYMHTKESKWDFTFI